MIKRLLFSFSFIITCTGILLAQNLSENRYGKWNVGLNTGIGFIMPHHPNMIILQQGHVKCIELYFEKNTNGEKSWHQLYNYPSVGYSYQFFDLGADDYLGKAHAINMYLKVNVINGKKTSLFLRPTFGLGYVEKVYDPEFNNKNVSMSTKVNALLKMQVGWRTYFNSRLNFNTNINFIHFSNGAITKPNQGINMPVFSVGAQYGIGDLTIVQNSNELTVAKKWYYWLAASATVKQLYPPGGKNYSAFVFTAGRYKTISPVIDWGYGIDLTYDNSLKVLREREDMAYEALIHAMRGGAHIGVLLKVNNFGALINAGGYAFNNSPDNYFLYTKLGVRIKLTEKLFSGVNLKTHFAKADLLEWHLGYKFLKNE